MEGRSRLKKSIIIGFLLTIMFMPITVFAQDKVDLSQYKTMNLEETLNAEGITADLSNYIENDNQIPIYMFRGQGCTHCEDFLEYVAKTLVPNYGSYFKLVSFETWSDANNSNLLKTVSSFLGDAASGVPYIVIGDKTFLGYGESFNSDIESAITSLYNSNNRYDVFEEMNKEEKSNTATIVLWNVAITTIGVIIVVCHNNSIKNQILEELNKKSSKKAK